MSISILEKKSILGVRENKFAKYFKLLFKQPAIWMFDTFWLKNKKTLKITLRNISCFSIVHLVLSLSFSLMSLHHFKILFTFQDTFWFSLGGQYAMFIWIFVGRHKIKTGTLQQISSTILFSPPLNIFIPLICLKVTHGLMWRVIVGTHGRRYFFWNVRN